MSEAVIDARHGRFRYLQNDIWIGRSLETYGEFSELETQFLTKLCLPGHTVVEIGAHIGTQTVPLAKHIGPSGQIYAFEPQATLCALLRANVAAAGLGNVDVRQEAVGSASGELHLPNIDYAAPGNFGGVELVTSGTGAGVPQVQLDATLDPQYLHLIKVDAEGMELDALKGAEGLIQQHRPLMSVENDRVHGSADLIAYLRGLDYRLMWSLPPLFNPDNFFGEHQDIFPNIVSINMLCLPAERFSGVIGPEEITAPHDRPPGFAPAVHTNVRPRMLFVACQPSSGSTLLAKLLGESTDIGRIEEQAEGQWLVPELAQGAHRWDPDYPKDMGEIRTHWQRALSALDPMPPVILEKSPSNLCRMARLQAVFSDHPITTVRLTRDPMAICASWRNRYPAEVLQQSWGLNPPLPEGDDLAILRRLGDICGARFRLMQQLESASSLTIRYEDLVKDPSHCRQQVLNLLPEVPPQPDIELGDISSGQNDTLISGLTSAERTAVNEGLAAHRSALAAFGYGLNHSE